MKLALQLLEADRKKAMGILGSMYDPDASIVVYDPATGLPPSTAILVVFSDVVQTAYTDRIAGYLLSIEDLRKYVSAIQIRESFISQPVLQTKRVAGNTVQKSASSQAVFASGIPVKPQTRASEKVPASPFVQVPQRQSTAKPAVFDDVTGFSDNLRVTSAKNNPAQFGDDPFTVPLSKKAEHLQTLQQKKPSLSVTARRPFQGVTPKPMPAVLPNASIAPKPMSAVSTKATVTPNSITMPSIGIDPFLHKPGETCEPKNAYRVSTSRMALTVGVALHKAVPHTTIHVVDASLRKTFGDKLADQLRFYEQMPVVDDADIVILVSTNSAMDTQIRQFEGCEFVSWQEISSSVLQALGKV